MKESILDVLLYLFEHYFSEEGSLARVLGVIAIHGMNLTKLQSFPIPGSQFKYQFHADMEFDSMKKFQRVIEKIRHLTEEIKIYGVYNKGIWK